MAKAKAKQRGLPPNAALDASKQKEFNQKIQAVQEKAEEGTSEPGVVYLSRLPWGFDEGPMREFFSQFGTINKLRVSRNKKTGNSRGYAYIQFAHDEVAKIVAETMNNYLMFEKLIKCKHLTKVHPDTFKNATKRFRRYTTQEKAVRVHNLPKTAAATKQNKLLAKRKYKKKKDKLAELGIDYELESLEPGYKEKPTDKEEVKEIKQEIFSDDETRIDLDKPVRNSKKTRTDKKSDEGINDIAKTSETMLPAKKPSAKKTSASKRPKVVVDISDDETDKIKGKSKRSSNQTAEVVDSIEKDVKSKGEKRNSPTQRKAAAKNEGKKQKLESKREQCPDDISRYREQWKVLSSSRHSGVDQEEV